MSNHASLEKFVNLKDSRPSDTYITHGLMVLPWPVLVLHMFLDHPRVKRGLGLCISSICAAMIKRVHMNVPITLGNNLLSYVSMSASWEKVSLSLSF